MTRRTAAEKGTDTQPMERSFGHAASLIQTALDPDTDIPAGIASRVQGISTSKLYDDGGKRMMFAGEILKRSFANLDKRWTAEQIERLCNAYFEDIVACGMPPTLSGLALYMGWTYKKMEDVISRGLEGHLVLAHAKEAIRMSIEQAALDGAINPLLYFHQQKAYHGVIERQELVIQPIRLDPTEAEVEDIIDILPDGSADTPMLTQGNTHDKEP